MNKKKLFIFIGILVVIIAIAIVILTKGNSNQPQTPSSPTNSSNPTVPTVPQSPSIPEYNKPVNTITPSPTTPPQDQFSNYVKSSSSLDISTTYFENSSGEMAPISSVKKDLGFQINQSVEQNLYPKDYSFFSCTNGHGGKDFGIYLSIKFPLNGNPSNNDEAKTQLIRQWEPQMLRDLHTVLFPNTSFSEDSLQQPLTFKDGESRYAEITLPDGSKYSINYKIDNQSLYIASSLDCLGKGSDALFNP